MKRFHCVYAVCVALVFAVAGVRPFLPSALAQTPSPGNIIYTHSRVYDAFGHLITEADANNNPKDYPYEDIGAGGRPQLLQTATSGSARNSISQFDHGSQADRWKLDAQPEAPRTPFELRAGLVVPATLISGIKSDLLGQIMLQVAQDVYDSATGKRLLIPQRSRHVGSYSSDVVYNRARVLIAWQRIVYLDGKAMDIGAMPGADSAGYAGVNDRVNNHFARLIGSAFLISGVTAAVTYNQPQKIG